MKTTTASGPANPNTNPSAARANRTPDTRAARPTIAPTVSTLIQMIRADLAAEAKETSANPVQPTM